jgi:hypothetical protein
MWTQADQASTLGAKEYLAMRKTAKKTRPRLDVRPYRGQWVAVDPKTHKVVTHDVSLEIAEQKAKAQGVRKPILLPVPKSDAFFVGIAP